MRIQMDEIQENIFRICLFPPDGFICFNHFLIRDEEPALIHTGHLENFELLRDEVRRILDPATLRHIAFSHYEADECGSLNRWLEASPNAETNIGKVCGLFVGNNSLRAPQILQDGESVSLGKHSLQLLETPHFPHNWDASLFYEPVTQTLFCSDLGTQPGFKAEARTATDLSDEVLALQRHVGYMPTGVHMAKGLERLKTLDIETLAVMHGSTLDRGATEKLLNQLSSENRRECEAMLAQHATTSPR